MTFKKNFFGPHQHVYTSLKIILKIKMAHYFFYIRHEIVFILIKSKAEINPREF